MTYRSTLYRGKVRHTRLRPVHHDFSYGVYYAMFDLDELSTLDKELRLFSIGRKNLYGFDPADHGANDISELRAWVESTLAEAGVGLDGGRVTLLAFPRVFGYVFNPISVWYCYGPRDELRALIYEVRNTFGDRHVYVVAVDGGQTFRHDVQKRLHVSPFNPMDQTYRFTTGLPASGLSLAIELSDQDGTVFRAGLGLTRLPMTDANLFKVFLRYPFVTLRVIGAIHWQALRLWLKGASYRSRPRPPQETSTIVGGVVMPR